MILDTDNVLTLLMTLPETSIVPLGLDSVGVVTAKMLESVLLDMLIVDASDVIDATERTDILLNPLLDTSILEDVADVVSVLSDTGDATLMVDARACKVVTASLSMST